MSINREKVREFQIAAPMWFVDTNHGLEIGTTDRRHDPRPRDVNYGKETRTMAGTWSFSPLTEKLNNNLKCTKKAFRFSLAYFILD